MQGIGMNLSSTMPVNPPFIRFETRAIARQKTAAEGAALYYTDTDFALVTSHGSKDTVEKVVEEWFVQLREQVRQGRFPQQWLDAYKADYAAWKNDQELPVQGTPIKNWPVATPAEMKLLANQGLRAVEDLAVANEETIGRLGMGGRNLKQRAQDWVTSSKGQAPMVAKMDAIRQVNGGLEQRIKQLEETNARLLARLESRPSSDLTQVVPLRPLEDRLAEAQSNAPVTSDDSVLKDVLAEIGEE